MVVIQGRKGDIFGIVSKNQYPKEGERSPILGVDRAINLSLESAARFAERLDLA